MRLSKEQTTPDFRVCVSAKCTKIWTLDNCLYFDFWIRFLEYFSRATKYFLWLCDILSTELFTPHVSRNADSGAIHPESFSKIPFRFAWVDIGRDQGNASLWCQNRGLQPTHLLALGRKPVRESWDSMERHSRGQKLSSRLWSGMTVLHERWGRSGDTKRLDFQFPMSNGFCLTPSNQREPLTTSLTSIQRESCIIRWRALASDALSRMLNRVCLYMACLS